MDSATIIFDPLSFDEWLNKYKIDIRVIVDWRTLSKARPETRTASMQEIWLPKYKKGSWMNGKRKIAKAGDRLALIRIPAVQSKGIIIALDGCHRIVEMRPQFIVADILIAEKKTVRRCFADLINL